MTTTVNKTTTLYNAFWDVLLKTEQEDCLFGRTASELLEKVALGNPEALPADAARMSKALSEEIRPIAKVRAERKGYKFTVDRYWKNKQKLIKINIECQTKPCGRSSGGHQYCRR